jgi:hypothetical protein
MDSVDYTHKISAPAEIWGSKDDNGNVVSMEVINRKGSKNI